MFRTQDRWIAGVCGGIAHAIGLDPLLIRLAFLLAFIFFGAGLLLYLVLWILVPNETTAA